MKCTNNYSGVVVLSTHVLLARHLRDGLSSGELADIGGVGRAGGGQRRAICDDD